VTAIVERPSNIPEYVLDYSPVFFRGTLHKPAHVPNRIRDVRAGVNQVTEAPHDASVLRGLWGAPARSFSATLL
jgi:hypothetical protein